MCMCVMVKVVAVRQRLGIYEDKQLRKICSHGLVSELFGYTVNHVSVLHHCCH